MPVNELPSDDVLHSQQLPWGKNITSLEHDWVVITPRTCLETRKLVQNWAFWAGKHIRSALRSCFSAQPSQTNWSKFVQGSMSRYLGDIFSRISDAARTHSGVRHMVGSFGDGSGFGVGATVAVGSGGGAGSGEDVPLAMTMEGMRSSMRRVQ